MRLALWEDFDVGRLDALSICLRGDDEPSPEDLPTGRRIASLLRSISLAARGGGGSTSRALAGGSGNGRTLANGSSNGRTLVGGSSHGRALQSAGASQTKAASLDTANVTVVTPQHLAFRSWLVEVGRVLLDPEVRMKSLRKHRPIILNSSLHV